jgi:hypothetical protein
MRNPRTIILAGVSAKNDAANQIILSMFKKIDKKGSRTLGIITKPDCIQGAADEQFWFDLAGNKEVLLERGWHMVKNRSETEMQSTFQERNEAEEVFFNKGRFKELPRQHVGIEALRVRLSNLLLRHLTLELPALKAEMNDKLRATKDELADLGEKRETPQEQRVLLTKISMDIQQILSPAVNGHYAQEFFSAVDMQSHITAGKNVRRFRAVIQDLNQAFADNMRLRGHKYEISVKSANGVESSKAAPVRGTRDYNFDSDLELEEEEEQEQEFEEWLPKPAHMTPDEATKWVKTIIRTSRGHELPGSINPEVTCQLFWEQSEPWKEIAEAHIEQVRASAKYFIHQILESAAPSEFKQPLEDLVVNAILEKTLKDAQDEVKKLLKDKARRPRYM